MNGYPTYWITYATIIRLFLDKKVLLENIAKYNTSKLFYTSDSTSINEFDNSILFS